MTKELKAAQAREPVAIVQGGDGVTWLPAARTLLPDTKLYAAPVVSAEQQGVADTLRSEAEQCLFVLREIGSMDADDITGDDIDLRFEDEEGRDTGCDVSIVDYAERAAKVIEAMLAAAPAPSTTEGQGDE
jgi:hypothetical protein